MLGSPALDDSHTGEVLPLNVHHRRVRFDEFFKSRESEGVYFFSQFECFSSSLGESDDLLEPVCACGFYV